MKEKQKEGSRETKWNVIVIFKLHAYSHKEERKVLPKLKLKCHFPRVDYFSGTDEKKI